ncbi:hypothetical protein ERJ75_000681300 [Trypanosoma vivax]|uniref:Uncharacterized protein n=1 Tax=Trypanosoma vivax (strain Y486) TaxID=1055687 RepID=G0U5M7_TRYVY|nr:hypothetical protein ERJ75_000681300 [Trypanosoma vivax]CCC51178.1 conserved hypothetical protein [Trypanosoma vivax Y486]
MEVTMERIHEDLDIIRAVLLRTSIQQTPTEESGKHAEPTHDAVVDSNPLRQDSCGAGHASYPDGRSMDDGRASSSNNDTMMEVRRLRQQVEVLSGAQLSKSKLEVQLASCEAALRQSVQAHSALSRKEQEQQKQLMKATSALQESQSELFLWRERHQRLQREAHLFQQELDGLATQCGQLQTTVAQLTQSVHQVGSENSGLRQSLQIKKEECEALHNVQEELTNSIAREKALSQEIHALRESNAESKGYFEAAAAEISARREYWAAVQEQHEAIVRALRVTQESVREWEARFATECIGAPTELFSAGIEGRVGVIEVDAMGMVDSSINSDLSGVNTNDERESKEDGISRNGGGASGEDVVDSLEAKIVDLALHLQAQQVAAETAKDCQSTLAAATVHDSRELLEARHALATRRAEWENLTDANVRLQAALVARENYVEALQEFAMSLLDELTELSLYLFKVETHMATAVVKGTGRQRATGVDVVRQQRWHVGT